MAAEDQKFVSTPDLKTDQSTAIDSSLDETVTTPESSIGIGSEAVITVPDEGEGSNEVGIGNTEGVAADQALEDAVSKPSPLQASPYYKAPALLRGGYYRKQQ